MFFLKSFFFTALILFFSETYVLAQSAPTPEPLLSAETFSTGTILQDLPIPDTYYDKGKFEDWTLRCVKTNRPVDPCQLFQLMYNANGTPVAKLDVNVSNHTARWLPVQMSSHLWKHFLQLLSLYVSMETSKAYPFVLFVKMGCVARIGLTAKDMDNNSTGNQATVIMVPAGAPDQQEKLVLSLAGFTAGHKALMGN